MVGIYKITAPSGKIYIGQSVDIESRWKGYAYKSKWQALLYESFDPYGIENHSFEVVEECDIGNLNERERYWQDYYNVLEEGLNQRLTTSRTKSGKIHPDVIKKRIETNRRLGHKPPSWKGKKQSPEHIAKRVKNSPDNIGELISKGKKGKPNGLEGRKYTEKEKEKLYQSRRKEVVHIPTGTVYSSVQAAIDSPEGSFWKVTSHIKGRVANPEWMYY